jgi:hypothetical protein
MAAMPWEFFMPHFIALEYPRKIEHLQTKNKKMQKSFQQCAKRDDARHSQRGLETQKKFSTIASSPILRECSF